MAVSDEYRANFEDQFDEFWPVQSRRMFGGLGIYRKLIMIALVARDTMFLRTDARSRPAFEERCMPAFTYQHKNNKAPVTMPYSEIPRMHWRIHRAGPMVRDAFDAALPAKRANAQ